MITILIKKITAFWNSRFHDDIELENATVSIEDYKHLPLHIIYTEPLEFEDL